MPMVPEPAIAMLACARVGAVHSVVFAGFSATSLADRINDCEAKMVLTSDGNFRGNKTCLLYTSPSPRDRQKSRMPSSA